MSAADIEVDVKNLSISGTGISYTGYGIHLQHRGTGDIDMNTVLVSSSDFSAEAVSLTHFGTGDIVVDMTDATLWTRGNTADGPNPIHYGKGDLTVRMRSGSSYDLTTGGTGMVLSKASVWTNDAPAIYAHRIGRLGADGEKGDIDLTDVTLTTPDATARYRRGHTVSKAGIHAKDTGGRARMPTPTTGRIRTAGGPRPTGRAPSWRPSGRRRR